MVRFCPRCGAPMIPVKKGNEIYLKCTRCGYEIKANKKDLDSYRIKYHVEEEKRVVTSKATEARKAALSPEEREILREYYEVFLETFQEEEGGGGEE
jgi:DNA-directed RNA polymerase subunit M